MNEGKRLVKNTLILAVAGVATKLITFFLLPVYTAALSTSDYGIYDYTLNLSNFLIPIITLLLDEAMFRFLIDCKGINEKQKVFTTAFLLELGGIGVFSVVMLVIGRVVNYPYLNWLWAYITAGTISFLINPFLRGQGNYKIYAIYNGLISICMSILSVLFLFLFGKNVYSLFLASIISFLISAAIVCIYIRIWKYIKIGNFSVQQAGIMIRYSLPLIPNRLSWVVIGIVDRIILLNLMGSASAGIYAIANRFPLIMDSIYGFFSTAWQESASRSLNNETKTQFYNQTYQYMQRLVLSINALLCAGMPFLFSIMIHSNYNDALNYIPILLIATIFSEMASFYGGVFYAYKDTRLIGKSTVAAAILKVVITIVLIKEIGIYGCAFSTLISNIILCVYRRAKLHPYVSLQENRRDIFISGVLLALAVCSCYLFNHWLQFGCCLIAFLYALIVNKDLCKKLFQIIHRR